ncbi:MAG: hypothetical protein JSR73_15025 [Proteobacteria bacterium]|nr:hypothetical protein [Pseudomonadota bacterium]
MPRMPLPGRVLRVAAAGLAMLLAGSYCSWRGYYVPSGLQGSSSQVMVGPVGGFGSVFVDGVEFADGNATLTIDGVAASEAQLTVGRVATVTGGSPSAGAATASTIAVTTKLVAPVSAIDLAGATLTLLGQTVRITGDTSVASGLAPTDPGGVTIGTLLAVDGYRTSTGLIASRVDLASLGSTYQVAGRVTNLDTAAATFTIDGTTVDYSAAGSGVPSNLTNGQYVVATGATLADSATLRATLVSAQSEVPAGASGAAGTVHGAITRFGSVTDFDVGGQTVATTATTTFTDGASTDLAADVELEVAGSYAANAVLTASQVTLWPAANVRIVGAVSALDRAGQTFAVDGITVTVTAASRWDDRSATQLRSFGLASLAIGDWVVVRGVAGSGTTARARIIERATTPSPVVVELQDAATAVAAPNFTLTGITVIANSATFAAVDGSPLSSGAFFAAAPGRLVRARGSLSATGALVATSVSLRD